MGNAVDNGVANDNDAAVDMLQAALDLVEASGVRVHPMHPQRSDGRCGCHPPPGKTCSSAGKHPRVVGWQREATTEAATIRAWWTETPTANIGIAPGAASGVIVLDVDGPEGEATLAALEAVHGALPSTVEARSGRPDGGRHLYFAAPDYVVGTGAGERSGLGKGLDVRGEGGNLVVPPSKHESGARYTWVKGHELGACELAAWPQWLCRPKRVREAPPPSAAPPSTGSAYLNAALEREGNAVRAAHEGNRNDQLNASAFNLGQLVAGAALNVHLVRSELRRAAIAVGLGELEARRTIESGLAAGAKDPRRVPEPRPTPTAAAHKASRGASERAHALGPLLADHLPSGVAAGTDLALACLLREEHGADLLHCAEFGWLAWDGRRYAPESADEVSRRMQNVGRRLELGAAELARGAANTEAGEGQKRARVRADALARWARTAQSAGGIRKAIELAQTLLPVRPSELDADPMLLTCESGTIELCSGELREHRRADRITRLAPVAYDAGKAGLRWETFIAEVLPDPEIRAFVQRYLGYACTGSVGEQAFVIALGGGNNGKSVLAETVRKALGDYTRDTSSDTLMYSRQTRGVENDVARLRGARFVTAKETQEGKRLDEARVKQLTGGDTLTARFLFHEHFEFIATFKLWLYCNHKPQIRGVDEGVWRRVLLVPFDVMIPPEKRDTELPAKLQAELPGVLAWLVQGCLEWQRTGLQPPAAVRAATTRYRDESNDVVQFVADCCVVGKAFEVKNGPLYERYTKWAHEQGNAAPLTHKAFSERLSALGYEAARTGTKGRYWRGFGLQADPSYEDHTEATNGRGDTW